MILKFSLLAACIADKAISKGWLVPSSIWHHTYGCWRHSIVFQLACMSFCLHSAEKQCCVFNSHTYGAICFAKSRGEAGQSGLHGPAGSKPSSKGSAGDLHRLSCLKTGHGAHPSALGCSICCCCCCCCLYCLLKINQA